MNAPVALTPVFRQITVSEASDAFRASVNNDPGLANRLDHDELTLELMAVEIVGLVKRYANLLNGLRLARKGPRVEAYQIDEYAIVEALFYGALTPEAETLLKAMVCQRIAKAPPPRLIKASMLCAAE